MNILFLIEPDRFEGEPLQEENKFLAGSTHFQLDEIEVFQKE
jgi:hypothetical protein